MALFDDAVVVLGANLLEGWGPDIGKTEGAGTGPGILTVLEGMLDGGGGGLAKTKCEGLLR